MGVREPQLVVTEDLEQEDDFLAKTTANTFHTQDFKTIQQAKRMMKWRNVGVTVAASPVIATTIVAMTIIGTVGTAMIFPGLPLWFLAILTVAGLVVDSIFYRVESLSAFRTIFRDGLFPDLKNHIVLHELNHPAEKKVAAILKAQRAKNGQINAGLKSKEEEIKKCPKNNAELLKKLSAELAQLRKERSRRKQEFKLLEEHLHKKLKKSSHVAAEYLQAWQLVRKKELVSEKKRQLIPGHTKSEAKLKVARGIKETCQQSDRLLDHVGLRVNTILKSHKNEILVKKVLIVLGIILALINGIGWGCMAFTHVAPLLLALSFFPAAGIPLVAGFIGLCAGFCWFLMIYQTVSSAIKKNIFRKIWDKLQLTRKPDWKGELTPLWLHMIKCAAKLIPISIIIGIALVTTVLTMGALLDSTVQIAGLVMQYSDKVVNMLIKIMMGVALPFSVFFSLQHSAGAWNKTVTLCKESFLSKEAATKIYRTIKKKPLLSVVYAAGFVIAGSAFLVHLVAEAASTAGEGAAGLTGSAGKFFKLISKCIGLKPAILATMGATMTEGLEHLDFVLRDTKDTIKAIYQFFEKLFGFDKKKKADKADKIAVPISDPPKEKVEQPLKGNSTCLQRLLKKIRASKVEKQPETETKGHFFFRESLRPTGHEALLSSVEKESRLDFGL